MEGQANTLDMPGIIIFDMAEGLANFRQIVGTMKTPTCLDETISRIMGKIADELSADQALDELGQDIVNEHRRLGEDLEGEVYSKAAMRLGACVLSKVRECQLYLPDGSLNYYFHSRMSDTTIILHEGSPVEVGGETNELAK